MLGPSATHCRWNPLKFELRIPRGGFFITFVSNGGDEWRIFGTEWQTIIEDLRPASEAFEAIQLVLDAEV